MLRGEIVYYHCFAPITPYSYGDEKAMPHIITPVHLGGKQASVYVEAPIGESVTLVGLRLDEKDLDDPHGQGSQKRILFQTMLHENNRESKRKNDSKQIQMEVS